MEKPATFINRPLTRNQLRRRFMRRITKDEIDWRNAPLMVKFLNAQGKLYNRWQSRLETVVHRRVARTIKKMRHLGLIPFVGYIKPTDKIAIGSYIEEVEEMHKKTIDPITGRLFLRHSLQDDVRDRTRREAKKLDSRTSYYGDYETSETDKQAQIRKEIIREMSLDSQALIPNAAQREWLSAQAHLLDKNGILVSLLATNLFFRTKCKQTPRVKALTGGNQIYSQLARSTPTIW